MATKGTFEDFMAALRQRESSGDYKSLDGPHYFAGAYQHSEWSLGDIGWYVNDPTAPGANNVHDWRGQFTAKAGGITSIQEFLARPDLQDRAFKEWAEKLHDYFTNPQFNTIEHVGKVINGVTVTVTGMIAGAHLVGIHALDKFLDTNGGSSSGDVFGTPVFEYIKLFSGYDSPWDTGVQQPTQPVVTQPAPQPQPDQLQPVQPPAETATKYINGTDGNDWLFGSTGNDALSGGKGSDYLISKGGNDILTGGANGDGFVFDAKPSAANKDTIVDYDVTMDWIEIKNEVGYTSLTEGYLKPSQFVLGTKAKDSNDFIIYDRNTGTLSYDPDGSGSKAAIEIAKFLNKTALAYNDFVII
jgi:hypothetical protein